MRLPGPRKIALSLFGLFFFVAAVALVRTTVAVSNDFRVFWAAADAVWNGTSPYDISTGQGMVFKYPPWILPVFMPFGLMPYEAAKWAWGLLEVLSLAASISWLIRRGADALVVFAVTASFWGIWMVHALDGQITLFLLAIMLWAVEGIKPTKDLGWRPLPLFWTFSAKIFPLFSLLGLGRPLRRWLNARNIVVSVLLFAALSAPAVLVTPGHNPVTMIRSWVGTAGSGGDKLPGEKIRGRENQGLPVMVLRVLDVRADRKSMDVLAFLLSALILGGCWSIFSAGLGFTERWVGWIALGAAVHPLAWFHSFVLAFPLAAISLDHGIRKRYAFGIVVSVAGILCTAVLTAKLLGPTGLALEMASIKSWGVVLCLLGLRASALRRLPKVKRPSRKQST
jgi:hypothetical protein